MSNLSFRLPQRSDNSEHCQPLASLSVAEKLKLTVDTVKDSGATFKSHDLVGVAILANKYHVMGMYKTSDTWERTVSKFLSLTFLNIYKYILHFLHFLLAYIQAQTCMLYS